MSRFRRPAGVTVALALGAAVVGGCGGQDEDPVAAVAPASQVQVVIRPAGDGGPATRRTVGCGGGDVCRRLRVADFSPTPADVACAQVYGGRATATVSGRVEGRRVDAAFDLHDACEIARWKQFAWLLGPPPRA